MIYIYISPQVVFRKWFIFKTYLINKIYQALGFLNSKILIKLKILNYVKIKYLKFKII